MAVHGMAGNAGGFIHHDDIFILIEDVRFNIQHRDLARLDLRKPERERITDTHMVIDPDPLPVQKDLTVKLET